ncbi:MAG: hypothetical protein JNM18_07270 [Planctomycetaceae bacterium]|nr:hypothetical protein [Planctomycetaceae bacterium]
MASLVEPDGSVEVPVLNVTLGGRRFPERWAGLSEQAPAAVPLRETSPLTELGDELRDTLWQRLPWRTMPPAEHDRTALVEAYVQSVAELDQCRSQLVGVIRAACEANIEFRQATGETNATGRDTAMRTKLDAMLKSAITLVEPIRNVADATTVSRPVESLRETFRAALDTAVGELVRKFFAMLATFVDRKLFGLVEWLPNQCCHYHFFRQVIVQENDGRFVETRVVFFDDPEDRDSDTGNLIIGRRTHRSGVRGRHFHRLARHRHDVMNAVRTTIGNSRVVMPPTVERLIAAIPVWLRPLVRIIDGEIFRERIIEQDTGVENWSDVSVRDEPIVGCEPGVTIGPYVLTGWGPREVEAELVRRRQVEERRASMALVDAAQWQAPLYLSATILVTLATLWFAIQSKNSSGHLLATALGTTVGIGLFWQATYARLLARHSPTVQYLAICYTGAYVGLLLFAEWLATGFMTSMLFWPAACLLIATGVFCSIAKRFEISPS